MIYVQKDLPSRGVAVLRQIDVSEATKEDAVLPERSNFLDDQ